VKLKRPTKIEVKESGIHGLGVFAIEDIEANEIIEECHLLTVREKIPKDSITLDPTPEYRPLEDYLFRWPPTGVDWDDVDSQMKLKKRDRVVLEWELENGKILRAIHPDETMVLLLGYGSIYNHSEAARGSLPLPKQKKKSEGCRRFRLGRLGF